MNLLHTLEIHASQIFVGVGLFGVSLVLSLAAVALVVVRLDAAHFDEARGPGRFLADRPAWQRALGIAGKNLLGFFLVILGVVMSLPGVPGQGLLTIFIGLVLLDVPGKRAIERRIIAVPAVLRACNRLRARFDKPPFTLAARGRAKERDELPDERIRIGFEPREGLGAREIADEERAKGPLQRDA
jgi:hypothetical protein